MKKDWYGQGYQKKPTPIITDERIKVLLKVGMGRFELPISRPPDEHFNRTKLHPEFEEANIRYLKK